jgi:hypothetical protein
VIARPIPAAPPVTSTLWGTAAASLTGAS